MGDNELNEFQNKYLELKFSFLEEKLTKIEELLEDNITDIKDDLKKIHELIEAHDKDIYMLKSSDENIIKLVGDVEKLKSETSFSRFLFKDPVTTIVTFILIFFIFLIASVVLDIDSVLKFLSLIKH